MAVLPPGVRPVENPPNRFSKEEIEYLDGLLDEDGDETFAKIARLQVYEDATRNILATNDSPDLGFAYSVNPYRGCFHACAYCYARPSHEYLGFGAGTDFDRKIVVKPDAPAMLREAFDKPSWKGDFVLFSGVTDCYQPLEASYRITRGCLEVCAEYRNPCGIITKAPLIERDIDVLVALSRVTDVSVTLSIPFWDVDKARAIEPSVATPQRRIRTVETLARAGISVSVNVAPLIPGLSDEDIPQILRAAKDAGATRAHSVFLRLPGAVATVFEERLRRSLPMRVDKVMRRVREARGGKLNDTTFGKRQTGEGPYARAVLEMFARTAKQLGLGKGSAVEAPERPTTFRRPPKKGDQLGLFG